MFTSLRVSLLLPISISLSIGQVESSESDNNQNPDFIVVGGGASGCVLAGRLSEKYSVLLLEAGGHPDDDFDVPAKQIGLLQQGKSIKTYQSVPQTNAGLLTNGIIHYTIGSTLGGGTSVNGMVYNRGSPYDYDNWANVTGDSSWSYDNLLRIFRKIENYRGQFPCEVHHGENGPVQIETSKYAPGLEEWIKSGRSLGYSTGCDPNGPQQIGFTGIEFSRKFGRRVSAFKAYVKPVIGRRSNLQLVEHATVKRIIFDTEETPGDDNGVPRAVGVVYATKEGQLITVRANKEIIISAGTMDSPAVLMRSGIGPKDVLQASGINPVKILPVGYNLQDHVAVKMDFSLDKSKADYFDQERDLTPESWKLYEETGDGPYASVIGLHSQAFLVSSVRKLEQNPNSEWPDVQSIHTASSAKFAVIPELDKEDNRDRVVISTSPFLVRPKSRGRVTLNSSDVDGMPVIDFRYLTDPEDMEVLLEFVKFTVKLHEKTPAFQEQDSKYSKVPYGPCTDVPFRSDDYWRCYIRHVAGSGLHAGGTCRMGRGQDDVNAVVDPKLKVIGVKGLRVVDLSIMPNVTNANTQAPAYVIAEKGSEMILEEWSG